MKVLILNSDSPNNRGDRAILSGLIGLIKTVRPDAEITSLSQFQKRDQQWFGIRFLPFSPYSLSPINMLRLLIEAAKSDIVLFGGGELLKDYTNQLSLYYWRVKISLIRIVNKNIIGAFQGIGPTSAASSKKLITGTVNKTKVFITRDQESLDKLEAWGAKSKLVSSFDPAVFIPSDAADFSLNTELDKYGTGFVGLGLRRWFHYQPGGFLPKKYKKDEITEKEIKYIEACADMADKIFIRHKKQVVFFPMHLEANEGDEQFAEKVIARMRHPEAARVVTEDLSPDDYLALIARSDWFIGSRLHSTILACVANVPAMVLYYVDKGRLFFEQLELDEFSYPIERMLEDDFPAIITRDLGEFSEQGLFIAKEQERGLEKMRLKLVADLEMALRECGQ
jgi:polysaccharide pyruvyl transferase WcaK-like protein